MTFTELFSYPNGDLTGNGPWAAIGGNTSLVVLTNAVTQVNGDLAENQATSSLLPRDWNLPWTWTSTFKLVAHSDAGSDIFWVCGHGSASLAFPWLTFGFNTGDLALQRLQHIRWHDATNGSVDVSNVPCTVGVTHTLRVAFDGVNVQISIDGVVKLTTAANLSAATTHLMGTVINMSSSDDDFTLDNYIITSSS